MCRPRSNLYFVQFLIDDDFRCVIIRRFNSIQFNSILLHTKRLSALYGSRHEIAQLQNKSKICYKNKYNYKTIKYEDSTHPRPWLKPSVWSLENSFWPFPFLARSIFGMSKTQRINFRVFQVKPYIAVTLQIFGF